MADSVIKKKLCIDIGGDSVKIGEFSYPGPGEVVLEGFSFMETNLGDISTDDPVYQFKVMDLVKQLIAQRKYHTRDVNVSISGQNAFIRFVKVPVMTDDREKIQQLLNFEAMQNLPFPEDDVVYGSQILENADPESGEVEAMFVIVRNSESSRVITGFEKLGRRVGNIEIASTACCNAAHFNLVGAQKCEMILNIGGRSSTLIFVDNGKFFVRTFLTAGHTITQQIAKEFNISYNDAEELKKKHGFVGLGGAYEEPDSEVASTVSKIIRNIMTRLHGEVMRTVNLYRAQHGNKPEKLYLTGGSSVMAYTPHFFSEKLKIPVEYLNPFQVVRVSPSIDKEELAQSAHLFSEVVGLAMHGAVRCPMEISLVPESRKQQDVIRSKAPYFYASCLVLLFCLSVTYWSIARQYDEKRNTKNKALKSVEDLSSISGQVEGANGNLNRVKGDFKTVSELYNGRDRWFTLLNLIQKATPSSVWYNSIRGASSVQDVKEANQKVQQNQNNDGFGGFGDMAAASSGNAAAAPAADINYIVLQGHIIISNPFDKNPAATNPAAIREQLLLKLTAKDGPFEEPTENDRYRMARNFKNDPDVNVSTFTIELKLKTPIKK